MREFVVGQVAGWRLVPLMHEKLRREERERARLRLERVALVNKMAREGNKIAAVYAHRLFVARRSPEEQDRILEEMGAWWRPTKDAVSRAYEAIQGGIERNMGMTVEDFLWLRDYESSRRQESEGG